MRVGVDQTRDDRGPLQTLTLDSWARGAQDLGVRTDRGDTASADEDGLGGFGSGIDQYLSIRVDHI
ncbi:hypothetical protein AB0M12_29315 [Nocardia vinacea]|uniref:hypothetical protein n=1 Tax=Nocardia vinacea TaxID=96468 RepID=UPI003442268E